MSNERPKPADTPKPGDEFGFTEREQLFDRVSHTRLLAFLDDPTTTVHKIEESSNNYGSFLFVTVSRPGKKRRILVTFWGAGYHEQRERWVTEEWFWYLANTFPDSFTTSLPNEKAKQMLEQHYRDMMPDDRQQTQSRRGQLFETLADLTDEDGAYSEMEDLPWWLLGDE